jgi:capsular polysaccharide biosynthesis protein
MSNDPQKEIQQLQTQLNLVEQRLQQAVSTYGRDLDDGAEIDLREIWQVIWERKFVVVGVTAIFAIVSVLYALSLSNVYTSTVTLAPAESESGGLSGLAAQYGGLAAIAGISLGGGGGSQIAEALEYVNSWSFLETVIDDGNLAPLILATTGWNRKTGELEYDSDLYDVANKEWLVEREEYSSWKSYEALTAMLSVAQDNETGFVKISIEHVSPVVAANWVKMLAEKINAYYKFKVIKETQKNIAFLEQKAAETAVSEMQAVFYSLIEEQTKSLMLASLNEEYLLKTIVPAKVAEKKSNPKRPLIVVLGVLLGSIISMLFVLVRHFSRVEVDYS